MHPRLHMAFAATLTACLVTSPGCKPTEQDTVDSGEPPVDTGTPTVVDTPAPPALRVDVADLDGLAVPLATVWIGDAGSQTDELGQATFRDAALLGARTIWVDADGYAPTSLHLPELATHQGVPFSLAPLVRTALDNQESSPALGLTVDAKTNWVTSSNESLDAGVILDSVVLDSPAGLDAAPPTVLELGAVRVDVAFFVEARHQGDLVIPTVFAPATLHLPEGHRALASPTNTLFAHDAVSGTWAEVSPNPIVPEGRTLTVPIPSNGWFAVGTSLDSADLGCSAATVLTGETPVAGMGVRATGGGVSLFSTTDEHGALCATVVPSSATRLTGFGANGTGERQVELARTLEPSSTPGATCGEDCDDAGDILVTLSARDADNTPEHIDLPDGDKDGFASNVDCDDSDATVHPGAPEQCEGIDSDCDGVDDPDDLDVGDAVYWYRDRDHDGYGGMSPRKVCPNNELYAPTNDDCQDDNLQIHPGAVEICNSIDDDCDGGADQNDPDDTMSCADGGVHDGYFAGDFNIEITTLGGLSLGECGNTFGIDIRDGEQPEIRLLHSESCEVDIAGLGMQTLRLFRVDGAANAAGLLAGVGDVEAVGHANAAKTGSWTGTISGDTVTGQTENILVETSLIDGYAKMSFTAERLIVDLDGDGFDSDEDCDDIDFIVHPDMPELCNGLDDDCDGLVDNADDNAVVLCGEPPAQVGDGVYSGSWTALLRTEDGSEHTCTVTPHIASVSAGRLSVGSWGTCEFDWEGTPHTVQLPAWSALDASIAGSLTLPADVSASNPSSAITPATGRWFFSPDHQALTLWTDSEPFELQTGETATLMITASYTNPGAQP